MVLALVLAYCPDFGWDRVSVLLSSWYSAVVLVYYENNVDIILMVWVVPK